MGKACEPRERWQRTAQPPSPRLAPSGSRLAPTATLTPSRTLGNASRLTPVITAHSATATSRSTTETCVAPLMVTVHSAASGFLRLSPVRPPAGPGSGHLPSQIYPVRAGLPVDAYLLSSLPHPQMISDAKMRPESLMTSNHHQHQDKWMRRGLCSVPPKSRGTRPSRTPHRCSPLHLRAPVCRGRGGVCNLTIHPGPTKPRSAQGHQPPPPHQSHGNCLGSYGRLRGVQAAGGTHVGEAVPFQKVPTPVGRQETMGNKDKWSEEHT